MASNALDTTDIALAFQDVSVSSLIPPKPIVRNITGHVQAGCITAVFGASASGKSLFLQALSGRVQNLSITGDVLMDGVPVQPTHIYNNVGYVAQTDMLIGDMTAREMIETSAKLKLAAPQSIIDEKVDGVLKDLGIDHVADTYIGTIFRAGLSGGQKRRVEIGIEFVVTPSILLLDEPTSGLDGSIAYDVLSAVKHKVANSNNTLSVALSIHQPNSRILELFDHILVLGDDGGMTFFGTVQESITHFTQIGFPPPPLYTPTDFYLQVTDSNFSEDNKFDFEGAFASSQLYFDLRDLMERVKYQGLAQKLKKRMLARTASVEEPDSPQRVMPERQKTARDLVNEVGSQITSETSFWTQFSILVKRDLVVASRDPTLYYLQYALTLAFGFMIGAAFFRLKYRIDSTQTFIPGGILWIMLMMVYINVFKVYHMNKSNIRMAHELANNSYSVPAYWCASLATTALLLVFCLPGVAIAFFMIGFPARAFPAMMLNAWMAGFVGDAMLNVITKFSKDTSTDVVVSQLALVMLTLFGGGVFIRFDDTPGYWEWLQTLSLFTHSSRMAMINVMSKLTYTCQLAGDGNCYGAMGELYECVPSTTSGSHCDVTGETVLYVSQGIGEDESYWNSFGYLTALFVAFELIVLFFMYFPVERLVFLFQQHTRSPTLMKEILLSHLEINALKGKVRVLIQSRLSGQREKADSQCETPRGYDLVAAEDVDYTDPDTPLTDRKKNTTTLSWKNLDLVLKNKGTKLIDNASGYVDSGRVLALMGPSGAGKTTLLNALAGRAPYADVTGEVMFAGRPLLPSDLMYVPQFDEIKGYSTVMEQIEFVGLMKCSDVAAMQLRLYRLLQILGLFGRAQTLCKDLSGGELKRVSVGMGMISNPNVLFLDEPTTGLDSTAAYYLVKYLVDLAKNTNVPVIMTIHQPAAMVFDMLQDLYLLEGGRLAFFGPIKSARPYYASIGYDCPTGVNPADFYLDVIYKPPSLPQHEGMQWREMYMASPLGKRVMSKIDNKGSQELKVTDERPSDFRRIEHILTFFSRYYFINPGYYIFRAVYLVLAAIYVGTIYLDLDTNTEELSKYSGAIFFSIWSVLFGAVGSTGLVAADRRQSFEQIKNGIITPGVYCIGQYVATIPYNMICAICFQAVFHWLTNINPSGEAFIYGIMLTFGHLTAMESLMFIVVEVVKDAMLSVTFAMVLLGTLFLFPGFFIQVDEMPVWISWMSYIVATKYSFDGYLHVIFHTQDFDIQNTGFEMTGDQILKDVYGQPDDVNAWGMFGILIAWAFLFRLIHFAIFTRASAPYMKSESDASKDASAKGSKAEKEYQMVDHNSDV